MEDKSFSAEKPQVYKATVNDKKITVKTPKITGAELLKEAGIKDPECHTLYQKLKGDFKRISMDEIVDLGDQGTEHFVTKEAEVFNYLVDGEPETTDKKTLTPVQIMELNAVDTKQFYLVQLMDKDAEINYAFSPEESIKMHCRGMRFVTRKWLDLVDIESYGKECKEVPPARIYRIKVDKRYHDWNRRFITVAELIQLEYPNSSAQFEVYKFVNTSPKPIKLGLSEQVDLTERCLVRFTIQPKEQTDGLQSVKEEVVLRREFDLPEEDVDFLNGLGLPWEAIGNRTTGGGMWILLHEFAIPDGYHQKHATVALMIAPSYPATEIDMAYFFPALTKVSGRGINALAAQPIDGKTYQRWSRHRAPGQWRPGVDNIASHLCLVENWLIKDLGR
ncbi:multiubiquitin domain-containing protein [Pedobacter nanyangensis]|uniref:multiubiquitin domain-containing protein n=1 Tax=Pedobacter nanyangensis TaxID=1562389 RepID=UPI000DE1AA8C|nr:multiubiquitin domain-containing protein [Pedobacter nanyangensis]